MGALVLPAGGLILREVGRVHLSAKPRAKGCGLMMKALFILPARICTTLE